MIRSTDCLLQYTVAIAADTVFAVENSHNNHMSSSSSSSSCLTLLITLTTSGQQKRDNKQQQQRDARTAIDGASDILIATSCIDTVVTLQSRGVINEVTTAVGRNNDSSKSNINTNKHIEGPEFLNSWKKKSLGETKKNVNSKQKDSNSSNDHNNDKVDTNNNENRNNRRDDDTIDTTTAAPDDDSDETILVHSLWQAEIQEQNHYDDDDNDRSYNSNGAPIVDYAFVEISPSLGNDENDDHESEKELRWKVS